MNKTSNDFSICQVSICHFSTDSENKAHLSTINDSLFAVCLDGDVPGIEDEDVRIGYAMHGSGSSVAACNRWFDKILQVNALNSR